MFITLVHLTLIFTEAIVEQYDALSIKICISSVKISFLRYNSLIILLINMGRRILIIYNFINTRTQFKTSI